MFAIVLAVLGVVASWFAMLLLGMGRIGLDAEPSPYGPHPVNFLRGFSKAAIVFAVIASAFAAWATSRDVSSTFVMVQTSFLCLPLLIFVIVLFNAVRRSYAERAAQKALAEMAKHARKGQRASATPGDSEVRQPSLSDVEWVQNALKVHYVAWIVLVLAPPAFGILPYLL